MLKRTCALWRSSPSWRLPQASRRMQTLAWGWWPVSSSMDARHTFDRQGMGLFIQRKPWMREVIHELIEKYRVDQAELTGMFAAVDPGAGCPGGAGAGCLGVANQLI